MSWAPPGGPSSDPVGQLYWHTTKHKQRKLVSQDDFENNNNLLHCFWVVAGVEKAAKIHENVKQKHIQAHTTAAERKRKRHTRTTTHHTCFQAYVLYDGTTLTPHRHWLVPLTAFVAIIFAKQDCGRFLFFSAKSKSKHWAMFMWSYYSQVFGVQGNVHNCDAFEHMASHHFAEIMFINL